MNTELLHLDVFGKQMVAERLAGKWQLSLAGTDGKRRPLVDIQVPADVVSEKELLTFLHDVYHEAARPGCDQVTRVERTGYRTEEAT